MKDLVGFVRRKMHEYDKRSVNVKNHGGIKNVEYEEANRLIGKAILSNKEFSLLRLGIAETKVCHECEMRKWLPQKYQSHVNWWIPILGSSEAVHKYSGLVTEAFQTGDYFANFYISNKEAKLIKKFANKDAIGFSWTVLEPYKIDNPWTHALRDRKVLVVSPFRETIENQYLHIDKVHENGFLPKFDLRVIQSVWWPDKRFSDWFCALDYLKEKITETEFDTALLSCSAFGVPLCSHIKKMGKQAIYVGGALQNFFGIIGNRWEDQEAYKSMMNAYWVRPDPSERPTYWKEIENGCYF